LSRASSPPAFPSFPHLMIRTRTADSHLFPMCARVKVFCPSGYREIVQWVFTLPVPLSLDLQSLPQLPPRLLSPLLNFNGRSVKIAEPRSLSCLLFPLIFSMLIFLVVRTTGLESLAPRVLLIPDLLQGPSGVSFCFPLLFYCSPFFFFFPRLRRPSPWPVIFFFFPRFEARLQAEEYPDYVDFHLAAALFRCAPFLFLTD